MTVASPSVVTEYKSFRPDLSNYGRFARQDAGKGDEAGVFLPAVLAGPISNESPNTWTVPAAGNLSRSWQAHLSSGSNSGSRDALLRKSAAETQRSKVEKVYGGSGRVQSHRNGEIEGFGSSRSKGVRLPEMHEPLGRGGAATKLAVSTSLPALPASKLPSQTTFDTGSYSLATAAAAAAAGSKRGGRQGAGLRQAASEGPSWPAKLPPLAAANSKGPRKGNAILLSPRSLVPQQQQQQQQQLSAPQQLPQFQRGGAEVEGSHVIDLRPLSFDDIYAQAKQRVLKMPRHGKAKVSELGATPFKRNSPEKKHDHMTRPRLPSDREGSSDSQCDESSPEDKEWIALALSSVPLSTPPHQDEAGERCNSARSTGSQTNRARGRVAYSGESVIEVAGDAEKPKSPTRKSRIRRKTTIHNQPHLAEILTRVTGSAEGFSEYEEARLWDAFRRFMIPGTREVHEDDLCALLQYLGHTVTPQEVILEMVRREVTMATEMDFEDFLCFMESFVEYECDQIQEAFAAFDSDETDYLDMEQLRCLLQALGLLPRRAMMRETLAVADRDEDGFLDYSELVHFLALYRRAECFTKEELGRLKRAFDEFARPESTVEGVEAVMKLPETELHNALIQVFSARLSECAMELENRVRQGGLLRSSIPNFAMTVQQPQAFSFAEFLILARKAREIEHERFCAKYVMVMPEESSPKIVKAASGEALSDIEEPEGDGGHARRGSDGPKEGETPEQFRRRSCVDKVNVWRLDKVKYAPIAKEEVIDVLTERGYTPLRQVLEEVWAEVGDGDSWKTVDHLDVEELFDVILIYLLREGFTQSELSDVNDVYQRFDTNSDGVLDVLELGDLLRYQGYSTTLDDIRDLVDSVDVDGSNQIDFREFLTLMHLFREREVGRYKEAFAENMDAETDKLPMSRLDRTLAPLGLNAENLGIPRAARPLMSRGGGKKSNQQPANIDFDDFVGIVDSRRIYHVVNQRKKAGFTDNEILKFQEMFSALDRNDDGVIMAQELQQMLEWFGWQPRSRKDQLNLLKKLDEARALAKAAGIQEVGESGSTEVFFPVFVQLARLYQNQCDQADEGDRSKLGKELRFTEHEIETFSKTYKETSHKAFIQAASQRADGERGPWHNMVPRDSAVSLLRSAGVTLSKAKLEERINGWCQQGLLSFEGFLRLMRWLVDTVFTPQD